jgi:hypothetical protein
MSYDAPFKILMGILGYWTSSTWGLFEVGAPTRPPWGRPCQTPRSYARRSGCLYTWFDPRPWLSFLLFFGALNQPCCLLQCSGTTLRVRLRRLLFSSSYRPVGKPVSHHIVTRPTFFFFFGSSYWPSCPSRCSDTTLWVHPWCPLIFLSSFRSIGSLLPIGRPSTSLCSAKTSNRSAAKLIFSFLFWTDVHAIWPIDSSTTSSWPF